MRIFLLLLISMCVFAAAVEPRLPSGKDLPAWAKQLSVKWEASWGKTAPWRQLDKVKQTTAGAEMRVKVEKEYNDLFATSFKEWASTAKLTKMPERAEGAREFNACLRVLEVEKKHGCKYDVEGQWLRNDEFFMAYAKLHNDPVVPHFLFVPVNRAKYLTATPK